MDDREFEETKGDASSVEAVSVVKVEALGFDPWR
jgi:hypothetical protein